MNVFQGGRRIAILLSALYTIAVVALTWVGNYHELATDQTSSARWDVLMDAGKLLASGLVAIWTFAAVVSLIARRQLPPPSGRDTRSPSGTDTPE